MDNHLDQEVNLLRRRIAPLEQFLVRLSTVLERPVLVEEEAYAGYRFTQPTLINFCFLRSVRIVSALNACVALVRSGFTQEVAVLLRTVIEFTTQVDYILASRDQSGQLTGDAAVFVSGYFDDMHRGQDSMLDK